MPSSSAHTLLTKLADALSRVIRGQETTIRHLLAGFAAEGHILLEDYPGTGKTTLAKALARSIDTDFKRIQFTPDLLPSDVVGLSIFDQQESAFKLHKGPVFTNILLVDEINRTSPRTQSALLEAMAEKQVSIDGTLYPLADLFFVIATQNPVESHGTYPLPEAQMDRFSLRLNLGYVDADEEVQVLNDQEAHHPLNDLTPCTTIEEVLQLRRELKAVQITDELRHYIVQLVQGTRKMEGVALGASPRASLTLMQLAKALALFEERSFVIPDDIQEIAIPAIAHRLIMEPQARFSGRSQQQIVEEVVANTPIPA